MKKYLILLIIPLLFFSTGCEDDLTTIQETELDSNLFGVWTQTYSGSIYIHSFSENGKWGYSSNGGYVDTGNWWTEGVYLWIDVDDQDFGQTFIYSVDGDELTLNSGIWTKVN